jgi:hypothetical protein
VWRPHTLRLAIRQVIFRPVAAVPESTRDAPRQSAAELQAGARRQAGEKGWQFLFLVLIIEIGEKVRQPSFPMDSGK